MASKKRRRAGDGRVRKPRRLSDRTVALLGLLLGGLGFLAELPQAVQALQSLGGIDLPTIPRWVSLPLAGVGSGIALLSLLRHLRTNGVLWMPVFFLARRKLSPVGTTSSATLAGYTELISDRMPVLDMTIDALAERSGLPPRDIAFLVRNQSFMPRADVVAAIKRGLMVPDLWPSVASDRASTMAALEWLYVRGHSVIPATDVEHMTDSKREAALEALLHERRVALWRK